MNVAAAPVLPTTPVADGSMAAAGQGEAPVTGFDALLAMIDTAVVGAPEVGTPTVEAPAVEAPDPSATPPDALISMLAAMMTPAPAAPVAEDTLPVDVAEPLPLTAATTPARPPEAAADMTPPAAPETELAAAPPMVEPVEPKVDTAPAKISATTQEMAPPREAPRSEPRERAAGPMAPEPIGKTAAKAVETETADAVAQLGGANDRGAGTPDAQAQTAEASPAAPAISNAATPAPAAPRHAEAQPVLTQAAPEVRGSPETVARLSADILKKLDGRATRFEIALDPLGLGRVDVKMEIGAGGQVSANLSFDTAHAAAELRGRANELRHALQEAGFDLPDNALSFDVNSQAQGDGRGAQTAWDFDGRGQGRGSPFAGRAFEAAFSGADTLVSDLSTRLGAARADGVDIRI